MTKISSHCKLSLESKDFNRYDVVADKKLNRSEMSDDQFECFVQQLVRTSDRTIRKEYVDAIQNKLWESLKVRLSKMLREKVLPPDVRKRIKSLLKYEFTSNIASGSAALQYVFDYYKRKNVSSGVSSRELEMFHHLVGKGTLKINVPFKGWRLISNLELSGSSRWNKLRYKSDGDDPVTSASNYGRLSATSDVTLVKRNSRFKLYAKALAEKNWNAPADQRSAHVLMKGALTIRHPFKTGLSLYMSGEMYQQDFAAPYDSSYFTKANDRKMLRAKASYIFGKGGIIADYMFKEDDITSNFYQDSTKKHWASLLAHIKFKKGYVRIGGGGGVWNSRFRLLGDDHVDTSEGAETHLDTLVQWRPSKQLTTKVSTKVMANRSEGVFNGWYPSYVVSADIILNAKRFMTSLHGDYYGLHRDLDHRQTFHNGNIVTAFAYRLSEKLNVNATASFGFGKQIGHQSYFEWLVSSTASIGARIWKKGDLWLSALIGYSRYHFANESFERDQDHVWTNASLMTRF